MYKTITTELEVDIDLADFGTQELLDELKFRRELPADNTYDVKDLLTAIWLKRRMGRTDYQLELDQLIYALLGHVI